MTNAPPETAQALPTRRGASPAFARDLVPLAGAVGSYGLAAAFLAPTLSLFLAEDVHADPFLIGLFFVARGAASIGASQATGRLSDRLRDRRVIIGIAGVSGAVGGLCLALLRDYPLLLVTTVVFSSIGYVSFTQLFAYAKEYATTRGRPATPFTSAVRSVFSAAWVVGPPVGLFIAVRYGFGPLYLATAGLSLATAVLGRWGLRRVPRPATPAARAGQVPGGARRRASLPARMWLLLGAIVALGTVNQVYAIDVSLYVTQDLHRGAQVIGWMAGLCAGLEIPVMIITGRIADRIGKLRVVLAATAVAAVFFCLLPLASSPLELLGLQVLNATWVGVSLSIPMVMVQDEAPGGAGASSSLYSSAFMAASLLAGAVAGVTATAVGYGNVFWACAALSAVAGILLIARGYRPPRAPAA
ncbi:MAG TPA: sugar efflux transporter [Trebonia sp.]|nr:sugar efflux transporter [Trebonia sp.]